jgi:branched-chain amino acid aminotransferase
VLPGITRQVVIELAGELGIKVVERDVPLFDAYTADELFVTSTSFCVCPVASLNGVRPRAGRIPGPVTARLQKAFSARVGVDVVDQYVRHAGAGVT